MKDALIVSILSVIPRKRSARTMGWLARTRLSRAMMRLFVRAYGVDLDEAQGSLADYPTLEALFTRPLKEGCRVVEDAPEVLVSPVDGRCAAVGRSRDGVLELVHRRHLDLASLLDEDLVEDRDVIVLYLSPKDYHRVHVPREGVVTRYSYLPGTLWPVFPAALRRVKNLFSRNERVSVHFETDRGPLDVVLVGAFGVGRISLVLTDLLTNTGQGRQHVEVDPPHQLERGGELGAFHLGSTVVIATAPGRWRWTVRPGDPVRMGRPIGVAVAALEDHGA